MANYNTYKVVDGFKAVVEVGFAKGGRLLSSEITPEIMQVLITRAIANDPVIKELVNLKWVKILKSSDTKVNDDFDRVSY